MIVIFCARYFGRQLQTCARLRLIHRPMRFAGWFAIFTGFNNSVKGGTNANPENEKVDNRRSYICR